MSLTDAHVFECPYCMSVNDIEIDLDNDLNQHQIVDCQICCAPIEIFIHDSGFGIEIIAQRDDE